MQPTDAPPPPADVGAGCRQRLQSSEETGGRSAQHAVGYIPFLRLPPEVPAGRMGQGRPRKASRVSASSLGGHARLSQGPHFICF